MRLVIQRVSSASVRIDGETVSSIDRGLLVLVGVVEGDTPADVEWLVGKTAAMRIFPDENGVMNKSLVDIGGDALSVSQFTLTASTKKGNRPSYIHAAGHELAIPLYEAYCEGLSQCDKEAGGQRRLWSRYAGGACQRLSGHDYNRFSTPRMSSLLYCEV